MADIVYPTTFTIDGPWLIDADRLQEFDQLLARELSALTLTEKQISEKVGATIERTKAGYPALREADSEIAKIRAREEQSLKKNEPSRKLTVQLGGGKTLAAESFADAARHPEVVNAVPRGFRLTIDRPLGFRCDLSVEDRRLRLSLYGTNAEEARSLFDTLRLWAEKTKAATLERLWVKATGFGVHWGLWFIIVSAASEIIIHPSASPYKEQAHRLLSKGLLPNEQLKALELLLALESNYDPHPYLPAWFSVVVLVGLLLCILLSVRPNVVLALGKGVSRVNLWRWWVRVVFVSVPLFLFSTVASVFIKRFVETTL